MPSTQELINAGLATQAAGLRDSAESTSLADQRREYYQAVEYNRLRGQLDQARSAGLLSPEQYTTALNGPDKSNWVQHALGLAGPQNTGGVLETLGNVLSLGTYATASLTEATIKTGYDVGPFKLGFAPSALAAAWNHQTTYSELAKRYNIFGDSERASFWGGLGADIAMDPLTWLTMGVGPGTKVAVTSSKARVFAGSAGKVLPDVAGLTDLTLSKYGARMYKLAAVQHTSELLGKTAEHNLSRHMVGEAATHLLDKKLVGRELQTRIGEYMVTHHDRLQQMMAANVVRGGETRLGRVFSYLPGTDEFADRAMMIAREGFVTVAKRDADSVMRMGVADLFEETTSALNKDRGIFNAFGATKNYGPALQGKLAAAPLVGGAFTKFFDIFDHGWQVPADVVETQRFLRAQVLHNESVYNARIVEALRDATPDEMSTAARLVEAWGVESGAGAVKELTVPVIDESPEIFDELTNAMVPNPNFRLPVLDNGVPRMATRVVHDATKAREGLMIGPQTARITKMAEFAEHFLAEIEGKEFWHGLRIEHMEGYIPHVYKDAAQATLVKELVAKRMGADALKVKNRFAQSRMIATIEDAEALLGEGAVETNLAKILTYRARASENLIAQDALYRYTVQHHGTAEAVVRELRAGMPTGMLRAMGKRIGQGVHFVLSADQVYAQADGKARQLGFRAGDEAFNRKLVEYLQQPNDLNGKYSERWSTWAKEQGVPEDARNHFRVTSEGAKPLPATFSYSATTRPTSFTGGLPTPEKETRKGSFNDALKVLSDTSHPGWDAVFATHVGQSGMEPSLPSAFEWAKGLDAYTRKHLETPLEGLIPDVRQKILAAYEASTGVGKSTVDEVLRDRIDEFRAVTREIAATKAAMQGMPRDASYAAAKIRRDGLVARAKLMAPAARSAALETKKYKAFHAAMDALEKPLYVNKNVPGLPTPFVDLLRRGRRELGVLVDEVPVSRGQMAEVDALTSRMGFTGPQLREVYRHLWDSDKMTTAGQADRLIRTLRQFNGQGVGDLAKTEKVTLQFQDSPVPLYPEDAIRPGELPVAPGEYPAKSVAGATDRDMAARSIAAGQVPMETVQGIGGHLDTIPRREATAAQAKLEATVNRVLDTLHEKLPGAIKNAEGRAVILGKVEGVAEDARTRVKNALSIVAKHRGELDALKANVNDARRALADARSGYGATRTSVSGMKSLDPAFQGYKATGKGASKKEVMQAHAAGVAATGKGPLYAKGKAELKAAKELVQQRQAILQSAQARLAKFIVGTGAPAAKTYKDGIYDVIAREFGSAKDVTRDRVATQRYIGDLQKATKKVGKDLRSLEAKLQGIMFDAPTVKMSARGRPVGEAKVGGVLAETDAPKMYSVTAYLPKGTADFLNDFGKSSIDPAWSPAIRKFVTGYDKVVQAFKADLIAPWTGSFSRDVTGNIAINYLRSGLAMFHPDTQTAYWHTMLTVLGRESGLPEFLGITEGKYAGWLDSKLAAMEDTVVRAKDGRMTTVKEVIHEARRRGVFHAGPGAEVLTDVAPSSRFAGAVRGAAAGAATGAVGGAVYRELFGSEEPVGGWLAPENTSSLVAGIAGLLLGARGAGGASRWAGRVDDAIRAGDKQAGRLAAAGVAAQGAAAKVARATDSATSTLQGGWRPFLRSREWASDIPARLGVFVAAFRETGSFAEAGEEVYRHLNDWGALSPFEKRYIRRAIPFYNWTKLAFRQTGATLFSHPARTAAILKGVHAQNLEAGVDPEDVPDFLHDHLVIAGDRLADGSKELHHGFGLPVEDVAGLASALLPDVNEPTPGKDARQVWQAVLSRGPFGIVSALEYGSNVDALTGDSLMPDPAHGVYETRSTDQQAWAGAPAWLQGLVGFQPATKASEPTVLHPRMAWALGEIPPARFIALAQQVHDAEDPSALNYRYLARTFLGKSVYVLNPADQRFYANAARLDAIETLLFNVGVLRSYVGSTPVEKRGSGGRPTGR